MSHAIGNVRLKAARQHAGFASQQALADALTRAAPRLGLGTMVISSRQIRRWESATPPWPRADYQKLLVQVLQLPVEELGFTPPWAVTPSGLDAAAAAAHAPSLNTTYAQTAVRTSDGMVQPAHVAGDYGLITAAYRRLYATVAPSHLHDALVEHTKMGAHLVPETTGVARRLLAVALAEALLLVGRIEFFDLQRPGDADRTYVQALAAAGDADDPLLGSAILAHAAFIPGWSKDQDQFRDRLRAARVYARRTTASSEFLAWLDAVEAVCETMSNNIDAALRLIGHAESILATPSEYQPPEWFTWFSSARLAAFKGNTLLKAKRYSQAQASLKEALQQFTPADAKQTTIILGDLAAVEAERGNAEEACRYAEQALDQLARTWYAAGIERVIEVRKALHEHADRECVQSLDDRLYGWQTTLNSLRQH